MGKQIHGHVNTTIATCDIASEGVQSDQRRVICMGEGSLRSEKGF